jgi:aminopeptidase YwaD
MKSLKLTCSLFFFSLTVFAQHLPFNQQQLIPIMKQHVQVLAHDSMEGRLVGTVGEAMAYQYISAQLQKSGLQPMGTDGYLQQFSFTRHALNTPQNFVIIRKGKTQLVLQDVTQGFALPQSGSGKVKAKGVLVGHGVIAKDGSINDYASKKDLKGKVFVMQHGYPLSFHPHSEVAAAANIDAKVDSAITRGASAVVIVATDTLHQAPRYKKFVSKALARKVPVVFLYATDVAWMQGADVSIEVQADEVKINGHNVIGYINNHASNTIILGAHYDHLGYDEFGHSTWRPAPGQRPSIHNGADDNASGTAALLVMADVLKKYRFSNLNYLFVAFSGEEEGLLGSNFFVKNSTVDLPKVLAMLNMDMVGRLDMEKYTLGISGTGTANEWQGLLSQIVVDSLKYKYTPSGSGGSDHASFYHAGIPVLHYFTGNHYDYHKPSDDEDKINYDGMYKVIAHMYQVIDKLNAAPLLTYTQVKEDTATRVNFKVTLGIMPDYMYEGEGVMVEGVTPERPAHKAGIIKGDRIVQIGEMKIQTMQDYMKSLSMFSKGQKVDAIIIRGDKQLSLPVIF